MPLTLTSSAADGWQFVSFEGSCAGLSCTVQHGRVTARFEPSRKLRINLEGLGSVRVDGREIACPAPGCDVFLENNQPRIVDASPSPGWVLTEVSGVCSSLPCNVASSGELSLRFIPGRRLRVAFEGPGRGEVHVGATTCISTCELVVPTETETTLRATPRDDFNRFSSFTGTACTGETECIVAAGTQDVDVVARFDTALLWVRSFPLTGDENGVGVVYADEFEVVAARSIWGSVDIDGSSLSLNPGSTGAATMLSLGWDAGVQWTWMLNEPDGGVSTHFVNAIARLPTGALVAAGSCTGGTVHGRPCSASGQAALRLLIRDGGVSSAETSPPPSQYLSAVATDAGVLLAKRRTVSLSEFELTATNSLAIQSTLSATNVIAQRNAAANVQEGHLFAAAGRQNLVVGDCSVDGGASYDAVLLRLNVNPLRCARLTTTVPPFSGSETTVRALRGNGASAALLGHTDPGTTFGSQVVNAMAATTTSTYLSRLTDARFEDTGWTDFLTPTTQLGPLLNEVSMLGDSVVIAGTANQGQTFFGMSFGVRGAVIARFAPTSSTTPDHIWHITSPSPQLDEVSSINIASWGDTLIVSIIASNGMINGVPLSNDGRKYWHVLALGY